MEEVRKWEVTYTKHVKQKMKVYHQGCLHLLPSNNKAMLYDESEKLLDSKFLNKQQCVQPGESITFPSFLVDIGDPDKPRFPLSDTSTNTLPNKKPSIVPRTSSSNNLSPSHKIIREFKKNEAVKYTTHYFPSSVTASSSKEWEALYTTQITQKAKKYQDGFIRLILCGSQGRQVALFNSSKTQIDKRFLKKDEVICSDESLKFDGHLVEIGDALGNDGNDAGVKREASNCISAKVESGGQWHKSCNENLMYNPQRCRIPTRQNHLKTDNVVAIGQSQNDVGSSKCLHARADQMKPTKTPLFRMPPRDVHRILSSLKKPASGGNDTILDKAAAKQCLSQPSELDIEGKLFDGLAQLDPLQATNVTIQHDCEEALANTGCSSSDTEKPVYTLESPNKSGPSVGVAPGNKLQLSFIPRQPVHCFPSITSPGTQPTRSTHQQPCDKLPETNASSEGGSTLTRNKLKVRRLFGGLGGMKMMRNNANTEFPVETLDCPSFDLGI